MCLLAPAQQCPGRLNSNEANILELCCAVLRTRRCICLSMRLCTLQIFKEHLNIQGFTSGLMSSHLTVQQSIGGLRWSKRFARPADSTGAADL